MSFINQLPEVWQKQWKEEGFLEPSLIQAKSFEPLANHQHMVGISPTGSGKTLAYVLPLLLQVEAGAGNQLLILSSSQELAMQVTEVARLWGRLIGLTIQPVIGGANVRRQQEKLKEKPEVLIGTPGRVLELIKNRKIKAQQLNTIVVDEADQLLQQQEQSLVVEIVDHTNKEYQLVFFSATAEKEIQQIAALVKKELLVLDVTAEDTSTSGLAHHYIQVAPRKRADYLRRLAYTPAFRALIFFNQLSELDVTEQKLQYHQVAVGSLASDQSKLYRKAAIQGFREGKLIELFVTDVAARGLDIEDLPYVINYDIPLNEDSYIHRAGRTARMGKSGQVITFIHEQNQAAYFKLMKKIGVEATELFLHGGRLHTERPETEEEIVPAALKQKTVQKIGIKKEKDLKKIKKRQKNQKNKGARRK